MARKKDGRDSNTPHSNIINQQALQGGRGIELHDTFRQQLEQLGLQIREMPGDGNCLFRALGDQLDGHCRGHLKHRHEVTQFMLHNRKDFEPFVEDDVPFDKYIRQLRQPGTYAGNDVIVAFARLHQLDVIIHQMNSPPWVIQGCEQSSERQIHISYSNGDHYSSVRRLGDNKQIPANIRITTMCICEDPPVRRKSFTAEEKERLLQNVEFDSIIECIIAATDCEDRTLIQDTLHTCNNDVEKCIEAIVTLLYDQFEDGGSAGPSDLVQNGARPKTTSPKISSRAERKLNKRERATERHKAALLARQQEALPNNQLPDQEDETLIQSLSTVQI